MNAAIAELLPLMQQTLWHGFIVFVRVGAIVSLLPAFGEQSVPMRIKLIIVMAFVLITAPLIPPTTAQQDIDQTIWFTLTETLIGLALGLGMRLFVMALQTAGSIAAQSTSLSQLLGGSAVDPLPAMGYILIIAGLALAVMTGLHVKAAALIVLSYELMPMGRFPNAEDLSQWGLSQVSRAFALAFTLAAPFVLLSVIYNLTLGAINKAMPQLMVAFVGAPLITAGGLLLLLLASPLLLTTWLSAFDGFLADPFGPAR